MSRSSTNRKRREQWAADQIANADRYTAVMFVGLPILYDKRWASSLEEARRLRDSMAVEYGNTNFGRRVVIYAVTPDDLTIFVE